MAKVKEAKPAPLFAVGDVVLLTTRSGRWEGKNRVYEETSTDVRVVKVGVKWVYVEMVDGSTPWYIKDQGFGKFDGLVKPDSYTGNRGSSRLETEAMRTERRKRDQLVETLRPLWIEKYRIEKLPTAKLEALIVILSEDEWPYPASLAAIASKEQDA